MHINVSHTISMGHRLPSYDGICSSPHGHNVRVEVCLRVPDREFIDFKDVSDQLRYILEPLDHAMVLLEEDPVVADLTKHRFRVVTLNVEPTTENIAAYVYFKLRVAFPGKLSYVTVHETDKYSATCTGLPMAIEPRRIR